MTNEFIENYKFKNKPFLHQQAYLQRFWDKSYSALFADTGTGKTYMILNNLAMLYDQGHINAALIIAPKGVYRNWYSLEIPKHMPDHVVYRMALWSAAPNVHQQRKLHDIFEVSEDLKLLIMNVEALSTPKGTAFAKRFLSSHDAFMAIDESTNIKNPAANRSKNAVKVGKLARYRRIMTGSPVTKSPMDLFNQCLFLSPDALDCDSFYVFQSRYAIVQERTLATHTFKQVVGYRRLDELQKRLNHFSFRVTKDE